MSLKLLVDKTERAVETAFLWLRILKALNRGSYTASQLRRSLNPMPHRPTFEASLRLMARLGLVERNGDTWRITDEGVKTLDRAVRHLKSQMVTLLEP